eukprot:5760950-Prymnesium_polylepis.1
MTDQLAAFTRTVLGYRGYVACHDAASGLRWRREGGARPARGRERTCAELARALDAKPLCAPPATPTQHAPSGGPTAPS